MTCYSMIPCISCGQVTCERDNDLRPLCAVCESLGVIEIPSFDVAEGTPRGGAEPPPWGSLCGIWLAVPEKPVYVTPAEGATDSTL